MPEKQNKIDQGDEIMSWQVPEYEKHGRNKSWYILASLIGLLFLVYAIYTKNFLFAVIIIVAALIIILHDGREPDLVKVSITDEGIIVGRRFYDYDEVKDFSVVYKPKQGVKNLYFEFKNVFRQRLSIPLENMNPLPIRENLLKYLPEDLDRTDNPLSERLAKMFKL